MPKVHRLESWIPPTFVWNAPADVFCVEVFTSDKDLVEFILDGQHECILTNRAAGRLLTLVAGEESLRGQLWEAAWNPNKLKPNPASRRKEGCNGSQLVERFS